LEPANDTVLRHRYGIDVEGDPSDRTMSPGVVASYCMIRVGSPLPTWFDEHLDECVSVPRVASVLEIGPLISNLEKSGEGRRLYDTGRSCLRQATPEVARAAFWQALEQIS
jgi:hypothetical protein